MTKDLEKIVIKQDWLESERGWGQRPDGCSLHLTGDDLQEYVEEYWSKMSDSVPDEYSRPCGEPYRVRVDKETYAEIKESKNGIRCY